MKKSVLAVILLFVVTAMSAQSPDKKPEEKKISGSAIEFSVGPSLAVGDYRACDVEKKKSGFATTGFQASLGFDWMGKKNLGLAFQYTYQRNPLQDTAHNVTIPGMREMTLGSVSWSNHFLMAGPVYLRSFGKLLLDIKVLAGIGISSSSNFYTPDPWDSVNVKYVENIAKGFAYHISAGVGYTISQHLTLSVSLNITGGWPNVDKKYPAKFIGYENYYDPTTGTTYEKPVYSDQIDYSVKKLISTVNPVIGIVYHL